MDNLYAEYKDTFNKEMEDKFINHRQEIATLNDSYTQWFLSHSMVQNINLPKSHRQKYLKRAVITLEFIDAESITYTENFKQHKSD